MKLIFGLGNPGIIYRNSRHNVGSLIVKALSKKLRIPLKKERGIPAVSSQAKFEGEQIMFASSLTFMNLSGEAVAGLLKKYKIDLNELLVVLDDLDLEFGRLKIRPSGTSGGHRGLKSIIASLKSQSFARLRIGIGRPKTNIEPNEYVLMPFTKKEKAEVITIIERASDCCLVWALKGITESMNIYNKRS